MFQELTSKLILLETDVKNLKFENSQIEKYKIENNKLQTEISDLRTKLIDLTKNELGKQHWTVSNEQGCNPRSPNATDPESIEQLKKSLANGKKTKK